MLLPLFGTSIALIILIVTLWSKFSAASHAEFHLRTDLHLMRKVWHCFMGIFIVTLYVTTGMSRWTGVSILGLFWAAFYVTEQMRLRNPKLNARILKSWGPLMRESEINRMSTTPQYIAAALFAIASFPQWIAVLSILYLAVGDPIASVFGILYGSRSIRFRNGKSLIGTLAGTVACVFVSLLVLTMMGKDPQWVPILSAVGGLAGGMAEMIPVEADDNFSIPMVSGFALWIAMILLGI